MVCTESEGSQPGIKVIVIMLFVTAEAGVPTCAGSLGDFFAQLSDHIRQI